MIETLELEPHRRLMTAALTAVNDGQTIASFCVSVAALALRDDLGPSAASKIERAWKRARERALEGMAWRRTLLAAAEELGWPKGPRANSCRAVYEAMLGLADRAGARSPLGEDGRASRTFTVSSRQVAEASMTSRPTVLRVWNAFEECGWAERGQGGGATPWRLRDLTSLVARKNHAFTSTPHAHDVDAKGSNGQGTIVDEFTAELHELWSVRGLGFARRRIWDALTAAGVSMTAVEIAALLGLKSAGPVRRDLKALESAQLVEVAYERRPRRWRALPADLDELAVELGVRGFRAERKADHERERRQNASYLRWRAAHPTPTEADRLSDEGGNGEPGGDGEAVVG